MENNVYKPFSTLAEKTNLFFIPLFGLEHCAVFATFNLVVKLTVGRAVNFKT
jgi:hypothetical protein